MLLDSLPLLLTGLGLGLLHALDADHVMAVSALSNERPSVRRTLRFSANWALGHGGMLLLLGLIMFGIGLSIPEVLQHSAELMVGVLLIVIGLVCLYKIRREKLQLKAHQHGDVAHLHWVKADDNSHSQHNLESKQNLDSHTLDSHKPVFVGLLHGLAGSAPALALIPAVSTGQLALALGYLTVFSLGVMASMLMFGLGFGAMQQLISQRFVRFFQWQRQGISLLAIALGCFWISQAI